MSSSLRAETYEEAEADATHYRTSMSERRNIGLRIVVGIVAFDLLILKLALDASGEVSDQGQLAWAIRLTAVFALLILTGMLVQIEIRNRDDRIEYQAARKRMREIRHGGDPGQIKPLGESRLETVTRSWATTWPLIGTLALTATIWWMAGLLTDSPERAAAPQRASAHEARLP